jgi:hypothetical protein
MEAVSSKLAHHKITCKAAFNIAADLSVPPSTVGIAIDLQEGRIISCQLGLFGYGKAQKKLKSAAQVNDAVKTAINTALIDGRLPCEKAWQIADAVMRPRMEISRACEALGVKICSCQIGAF